MLKRPSTSSESLPRAVSGAFSGAFSGARSGVFSRALLVAGCLGGSALASALPATALSSAPLDTKGDKKTSDDLIIVDAATTTPPGLIEIKGGNTHVGTDKKKIAELMENESFQGMVRLLDGETPKVREKVAPFLIGKYEVTNEQYFHFVKATNRRPPEHWGQAAIQEAQNAFLKAENEKYLADNTYKRQKWDEGRKDAWWRENWEKAEWSIPEGMEATPVSYVTYDDARDYCAWAGMRLPTEAEWVHAARKDKDDWFTWGDEWDSAARAHTTETRRQKLFPVGSFEKGVSPYLVHDLVGSVWEWTSSPYRSLEKFKPNTYTLKRSGGRSEKVTPEPSFNASFQVIKGGSYQNGLLAARITTRQGAKRSQTTNAIGFRVASSGTPGRDKAESLFNEEIRNAASRKNAELFDLDGVAALDRYRTESPSGKRAEGYGVVKGYDHILFAPRDEFTYSPGGELNRESRTAPVVLGFLSTTVEMAEPPLYPGLYLVSYREKGRMVTDKTADAASEGEGEGEEAEAKPIEDDTPLELLTPEQRVLRKIDLNKTVVIFTEVATGEFVAAIDASKLTKDIKANKADPASITPEKKSVWVGQGQNKVKEEQDWLDIHANIRMSAKRLIPFDFSIRVAQDALGKGWRK